MHALLSQAEVGDGTILNQLALVACNTTLYYTTLHYTILYYTILHYTHDSTRLSLLQYEIMLTKFESAGSGCLQEALGWDRPAYGPRRIPAHLRRGQVEKVVCSRDMEGWRCGVSSLRGSQALLWECFLNS